MQILIESYVCDHTNCYSTTYITHNKYVTCILCGFKYWGFIALSLQREAKEKIKVVHPKINSFLKVLYKL